MKLCCYGANPVAAITAIVTEADGLNELRKLESPFWLLPSGLCSASHVYSSASCRTVSSVGTTTSGAATLCVSTSIWGTLADHGTHSPVIDTWI